MQTIANAVQASRVKGQFADYATFVGSVSTVLEADLQATPVCPTAGIYTIENGTSGTATTFRVRCSASGHDTFEPGVDST